ncbi:uncharacterized protein LOC126723503 [Quercus robur]|uniref:uncharacterized protein LOC126723503 n=1 Tax=Quercus robur TaxID=38942 RepID=UPI00216167E8|nr:uncharacterized protein LOC126723503 [Quercus robur]XP_050282981.1 uncharacterized protein LOC126723503 [Quercus robur]
MVNLIPEHLKKIWDAWNIRGVILLSLSLQTILILFAPFRKRTPKKLMILLIWSSYLLADWAASFAIGHIANSQIPKSGPKDKIESSLVGQIVSHFSGKGDVYSSSDGNADLLAFWAPFLLVHLGGPDTITAFALEDNELWLRHLFSLLIQVLVTVYVFLLTLPKNKVWIPTILMFLAGIIKYCERTRALFLASLDKFRESMLKAPDPGPNYAKLMEEYTSKKDAGLPIRIEMTPEPGKNSKPEDSTCENQNPDNLEELEVVKHAYNYFKTFKGLIVELIFSFRERNESREFFRKRTAEDALKIIDLELNFIYEALFTKVVVVHSLMGYIFRFISTFSVVTASGIFFKMNKDGFKKFDVIVSYTLLVGAICLDLISLFMLFSSNWTIAATDFNKPLGVLFKWSAQKYLELKKIRWSKSISEDSEDDDEVLATYKLFRRWSESVSSFKLISYCLRLCPHEIEKNLNLKQKALLYLRLIFECFWPCIEKIIDFLGTKEFVTQLMYVESHQFHKKLWKFIFEELKEKSGDAGDAETTKKICSARGAYVIRKGYQKIAENYIENVTFDESLLLWHVATELCYHTEEEDCRHDREVSKILSDYMIYLLVMQPTMMSAVAGVGQIRFRDTCAEAEKFFNRRGLNRKDVMRGCKEILDVNTKVKPVHVKGDRSKSVLFDACMLAKELKKLNKDKWKIMSKVWVEMLSYAATHCRAATHAQQVSKGGQLISFVWLLMAHFGLDDRFQINEGHARAKLIVGT